MQIIGTLSRERRPNHLRLALLQLNTDDHDLNRNLRAAGAAIDEAAEAGADLVVLPEFFNLPYFAQVWDPSLFRLAETEKGPTLTMIRGKAREHGIHIVATIYERRGTGVYFDTAFLIDQSGEIQGRYEKVHPAAVKSLEKIYFRPGSRFPVWDVNGVKVSAIICYDHFFPEAARSAMINGADLLLGPFAAPKSTTALWKEVMAVRAFENGVFMAPCNKVGREGEWDFRGTSMVVDPLGRSIVAAADELEAIVLADIDPTEVIAARAQFPMIRDRIPSAYAAVTREY